MAKEKKEPWPLWRKRLVSIQIHKLIPAEVKADIRAAMEHIEHLQDLVSEYGETIAEQRKVIDELHLRANKKTAEEVLAGHRSLAEMMAGHIKHWREGLDLMRQMSNQVGNRNDADFWQHELNALDQIEKATEYANESTSSGKSIGTTLWRKVRNVWRAGFGKNSAS